MSNSKLMVHFNKLNNAKTQGELQAFLNELEPMLKQTDPNLHHKLVFNGTTLNLDYALKRALMGCAINDQSIQKKFLAATFYLLQRYYKSINIGQLLNWIEENVSYKAALNKSEKVSFEFANFCIKQQLIRLISDKEIHNAIKESIIDATKRREISKLLACTFVQFTDDAEFLMKLGNFKSQGNFSEISFQLLIYNKLKSLQIKTNDNITKKLNEQLGKLFKLKFIFKMFDSMTDTLQSNNLIDHPFYKNVAFYMCNNPKNLQFIISELQGLCKQTDRAKYSVKYACHSLSLLDAIISYISEDKKLENDVIETIRVGVEQLKSKNQIIHKFSKHLIDNFIKTIDKQNPSLLENLLESLYNLYDANHGFVDHKLFTSIYRTIPTHKGKDQNATNLILKRINNSITQGEFVSFKFYCTEYASALCYIKSSTDKISEYENLFNIYNNFKNIAKNFISKAEITLKKAISTGLNLLYEKITEAVFKEQDLAILHQLTNIWSSNTDELQDIIEEASRIKEPSLTRLMYFTVFINIEAEILDPQSIILKQVADDLVNFVQKLNNKSIESEDVQVLVDCLIALLNIPNQNLRKTCGEVLKSFVKQLDEESFMLIETELFEKPITELYDEEDEEGSDIILEGGLL